MTSKATSGRQNAGAEDSKNPADLAPLVTVEPSKTAIFVAALIVVSCLPVVFILLVQLVRKGGSVEVTFLALARWVEEHLS